VIQKCQKYIKIRATCASKSSEIPRYTCTMDGKPGQLRAIVVWFMVFNATFNNISVILWQSVLLGEETLVPGENHRPAASH
jgi:hypothetical protein